MGKGSVDLPLRDSLRAPFMRPSWLRKRAFNGNYLHSSCEQGSSWV